MRNSTKKIVREALRIAANYWRRNAIEIARGPEDIDADGVIALSNFYREEANKADKLRARFHNQLSDRAHLAASEVAPIRLNLDAAATIMRRDLFGPLGFSVPSVRMEWAPPDFWTDEEGATGYEGPFGHASVIHIRDVPNNRDKLRAAATLAHEMAHVAAQPVFDPREAQTYRGHPASWQALAQAIGLKLESPWYTVPGPGFVRFYNEHLRGRA